LRRGGGKRGKREGYPCFVPKEGKWIHRTRRSSEGRGDRCLPFRGGREKKTSPWKKKKGVSSDLLDDIQHEKIDAVINLAGEKEERENGSHISSLFQARKKGEGGWERALFQRPEKNLKRVSASRRGGRKKESSPGKKKRCKCLLSRGRKGARERGGEKNLLFFPQKEGGSGLLHSEKGRREEGPRRTIGDVPLDLLRATRLSYLARRKRGGKRRKEIKPLPLLGREGRDWARVRIRLPVSDPG